MLVAFMHNVKRKWMKLHACGSHAQRKRKMDGGATTKRETPPFFCFKPFSLSSLVHGLLKKLGIGWVVCKTLMKVSRGDPNWREREETSRVSLIYMGVFFSLLLQEVIQRGWGMFLDRKILELLQRKKKDPPMLYKLGSFYRAERFSPFSRWSVQIPLN